MAITYEAVKDLSARLYDWSLRRVPADTTEGLARALEHETHVGAREVLRMMLGSARRAEAAGVRARSRIEAGETAEVAAKIARDEHCDHIFLPEHGPTPVARALMTLTGLRTNTAASRILSLSRLPVTVIAHERHGEA